MEKISKEYPGVKSLDNVSLEASPGEVVAVMGENGAGKSTLMKILSGVIPKSEYSGKVFLNEEQKKFYNTFEARAHGVAIIHQELNLFPELSVAENLLLGMEPLKIESMGVVDRRRRDEFARKEFEKIGIEIDVTRPVAEFGPGFQQLTEILRALQSKAKLIVFDEPTSSLSVQETKLLFKIMEQLKQTQHTILYISHRMEEIFELSDRIVVLRDGKNAGQLNTKEATSEKLVSMMVGREVKNLWPERSAQIGEELIRVESLQSKDQLVNDFNFSIKKGEILGLAGLNGAGRSELAMCLFGSKELRRESKLFINSNRVQIKKPGDAIGHGIAFVTEDRKISGLFLDRNIEENASVVSLPQFSQWGRIDQVALKKSVLGYFKKLRVKAPGTHVEVNTLSGGNQQKVVLAKWLALKPQILILDEPTRGIDVGARQEIYQIINQLAESGMAVLMISSDLPELLGMSDRIMVMKEGSHKGIVDKKEFSQERIMNLAAGVQA
jgi:ABC-type sugar transport system ATPase subunit